jgi:hypothetical protein
MEVSIIWDMTFFSVLPVYATFSEKYFVFVSRIAYSEDKSSKVLRNSGKFLLDYTASH